MFARFRGDKTGRFRGVGFSQLGQDESGEEQIFEAPEALDNAFGTFDSSDDSVGQLSFVDDGAGVGGESVAQGPTSSSHRRKRVKVKIPLSLNKSAGKGANLLPRCEQCDAFGNAWRHKPAFRYSVAFTLGVLALLITIFIISTAADVFDTVDGGTLRPGKPHSTVSRPSPQGTLEKDRTNPRGNAPPTIEEVTIEGNPFVGENVTAVYTFVDVDRDEEGRSKYNWYWSPTPLSTVPTSQIVHSGFNKTILVPPSCRNGALSVEVIPYDGSSYGEARMSRGVKILDRPPVVSSIRLHFSSPSSKPGTSGSTKNTHILWERTTQDIEDFPRFPSPQTVMRRPPDGVMFPRSGYSAWVSYIFHDVDGDREGSTRIDWEQTPDGAAALWSPLTMLPSGRNSSVSPDKAWVLPFASGPVWIHAVVTPHDGFEYGESVPSLDVKYMPHPHISSAHLQAKAIPGDILKPTIMPYGDESAILDDHGQVFIYQWQTQEHEQGNTNPQGIEAAVSDGSPGKSHESWNDIAGATRGEFHVTAKDQGSKLRVLVGTVSNLHDVVAMIPSSEVLVEHETPSVLGIAEVGNNVFAEYRDDSTAKIQWHSSKSLSGDGTPIGGATQRSFQVPQQLTFEYLFYTLEAADELPVTSSRSLILPADPIFVGGPVALVSNDTTAKVGSTLEVIHGGLKGVAEAIAHYTLFTSDTPDSVLPPPLNAIVATKDETLGVERRPPVTFVVPSTAAHSYLRVVVSLSLPPSAPEPWTHVELLTVYSDAILVENTAPSISSLQVASPVHFESYSLISISYEYRDPDRDEERSSLIEWFHRSPDGDGERVSIPWAKGSPSLFLDPEFDGHYISVTVSPSDGFAVGLPLSLDIGGTPLPRGSGEQHLPAGNPSPQTSCSLVSPVSTGNTLEVALSVGNEFVGETSSTRPQSVQYSWSRKVRGENDREWWIQLHGNGPRLFVADNLAFSEVRAIVQVSSLGANDGWNVCYANVTSRLPSIVPSSGKLVMVDSSTVGVVFSVDSASSATQFTNPLFKWQQKCNIDSCSSKLYQLSLSDSGKDISVHLWAEDTRAGLPFPGWDSVAYERVSKHIPPLCQETTMQSFGLDLSIDVVSFPLSQPKKCQEHTCIDQSKCEHCTLRGCADQHQVVCMLSADKERKKRDGENLKNVLKLPNDHEGMVSMCEETCSDWRIANSTCCDRWATTKCDSLCSTSASYATVAEHRLTFRSKFGQPVLWQDLFCDVSIPLKTQVFLTFRQWDGGEGGWSSWTKSVIMSNSTIPLSPTNSVAGSLLPSPVSAPAIELRFEMLNEVGLSETSASPLIRGCQVNQSFGEC